MDWILQWVASAEGIDAVDLKTVEDAIEPAQELLALIKQSMPLAYKMLPLIQKVQPAASIILAAVARKQQPQVLG